MSEEVIPIEVAVELQDKAKEIVAEQTPEELLKDFLAEKSNIDMLLAQATTIRDIFKHKKAGWFNLIDFITKTNYKNPKDALQVLNLLKLSGFLYSKVDKKEESFKICISTKQKIQTLEVEKKKMLEEVSKLDSELVILYDLLQKEEDTSIN